jgi:hypothetical protein
MSEEDEIKGRSGEGLSREKRFKKRGLTDLFQLWGVPILHFPLGEP